MSLLDDLTLSSRDVEAMLCASAFTYPEIVRSECGYITPLDFGDSSLAKFWEKFLVNGDAVQAGVDSETLTYIVDVATNAPVYRHAEFAEKVSEYSYLRKIATSLSKIASAVGEKDASKVMELANNLGGLGYSAALKAFSSDDVDLAFRNLVSTGNYAVKTFITDFDEATGGLFPSELIVLAARPGMGKTSLCLNIARNVAFSGKKVLFYSLEMSKEQVWARMACPLAGVEWRNVRGGILTPAEATKLEIESVALAHRLRDKFFIHDEAYTLPEIHSLAIHHKPDLVIIDQLPEIHWHDPSEEEVKWYGKACKYLRTYLAKSLKIPVVLIHQLNRDVEGRQDRRPQLKDLKWSGDVEQRADVVLMAYRNDYYDGRPHGVTKVPLEVLVRKNRQGEMSQAIMLEYDLRTQIIR